MITSVDFTYTEGSKTVLPAAQGVSIDAFPAAKGVLENTISELTKERDKLKGRMSCLEAQLQETENGQAVAMVAGIQKAVMQMKELFSEEVNSLRNQITKLEKDFAPLRAEREARLEAERIALEKDQQERKEAALAPFIQFRDYGHALTKQIEHIQSMTPEEIVFINQQLGKGFHRARLMISIARCQWTKERMLQPWSLLG